jgi:hypothetical protein
LCAIGRAAPISAVRELATAEVAVDHARDALGAAETKPRRRLRRRHARWLERRRAQIDGPDCADAPHRRPPAPGAIRRPHSTMATTPDNPAESADFDADQIRNGG